MILAERHDLAHTTKSIRTPVQTGTAAVGTHPLGSRHEARYYPTCSCGWVGPVCAEFQRMIEQHAAHVKEARR